MKLVIEAATAAEASAKYIAMRDASGEGASTFPNGEWRGLRISYNGRVWNAEGKAIYPARENSPEIWHESCAGRAINTGGDTE